MPTAKNPPNIQEMKNKLPNLPIDSAVVKLFGLFGMKWCGEGDYVRYWDMDANGELLVVLQVVISETDACVFNWHMKHAAPLGVHIGHRPCYTFYGRLLSMDKGSALSLLKLSGSLLDGHIPFRSSSPARWMLGATIEFWSPNHTWQHFRIWWLFELETKKWALTQRS